MRPMAHPEAPAPQADAHASDAMTGPHSSMDDHGGTHGHDDHAHAGEAALEPINARAWGAGLFGIILGLVVALAFALASGFLRI
jgi:hypothetical protein